MTRKSEDSIANVDVQLANADKEARISNRGSGAVAARKAVAAGKGGVAVGRDVLGSIYIRFVKHTYDKSEWKAKQEILTEYLKWIVRESVRESAHLRSKAIDAGSARTDKEPPGLASVYVDLNLDLRIPSRQTLEAFIQSRSEGREEPEGETLEELRPVSVIEALALHRKLVLLGASGSGKSSLSLYLALTFAEAGIGKSNSLERLGKHWTHGSLLPVRVVLRKFAAWLPAAREPRGGDLWRYLDSELAESALRPETAAVLRAVAAKQGAFFLFDGLDEVGDEASRERVTTVVREFIRGCDERCRFMVTARPYAWEGIAMEELPVSERLADFEPAQVDAFIERWYAALSSLGWVPARDAERKVMTLREAARRPDLKELAKNPLLLTLMAAVHTNRATLPDDRADLYEKVVDLRLRRWKEGVDPDQGLLFRLPRLREIMEEVAFTAHARNVGREGTADIPETALLDAFLPHVAGDRGRASVIVKYLEQRSGLLLGQGPPEKLRQFTFPHRTFQEYLAGCYLSRQTDFEARAAAFARQDPDHWREVLVLAACHAGTERGIAAADALVRSSKPDDCTGWIDSSDWRAAIIAGEQLAALGAPGTTGVQARRLRVTAWLLALIQGNTLSARERVRACEVLGEIGDLRFRLDAWYLPDEPLLGFIEIPEGPFLMGTRPEEIAAMVEKFGVEKEWYEPETPQHMVHPLRYYVARYPVTVAQFRAFVEAWGYEPGDKLALRGLPHAPVVRVSWGEALAYCEWLSTELSQWEGTPEPLATLLRREGWRLTLPSEVEWEKAARGTEGGLFPWGNELDSERANIEGTGIGAASSVGCFPEGASKYRVFDAVGNVWEWCRSKYEPYPYQAEDGREDPGGEDARVLRGAAFYYDERCARCAYRGWFHPDGRNFNIGFRLVIVPDS